VFSDHFWVLFWVWRESLSCNSVLAFAPGFFDALPMLAIKSGVWENSRACASYR
jgi:hypothetical protein